MPFLRRSTLILPVNIPRFVDKAHLRGADAVMLDLEDAVPPQEKAAARALVCDALPQVARGGAEVLVRVNNDPTLLTEDVNAAVRPGLQGICVPKAESVEQIQQLDIQVAELERRRGIPAGQIEFQLLIETPRGLLRIEEIATASARIRSMSLGPEDYCLALGVEPSADGAELLYGTAKLVTVCVAFGIAPMGLLGSIAGFKDLAAFEQSAVRARTLGCMGASCIHPDQVSVLNRVFSPSPAAVAAARRASEAFEAGLAEGTASVNLDGAMVDIPVYRRAQQMLKRAEAIAAVERRKTDALRILR